MNSFKMFGRKEENLGILVIVLIVLWNGTNAARILMIVPTELPSHTFLADRLLRELASKGHEVTMISPYDQKTPVTNYRNIKLTGIREGMMKMFPNEKNINFLFFGQLPIWRQILYVTRAGSHVTEITLNHPSVQKLLNDTNERFDLIMFEMFYTEALYGLAHKYNAPVVVLSTLGSSVWTNHLVANPAPSSYVPDFFTKFAGKMSLGERLYNSVLNLMTEVHRRYFYFPQIDITMHKYFPDAPPLFDLMYNKTAMILLNSHPSISDPKPHVPAMVEVGGFHIEDAKPLPHDLQDFMDTASYGVILFSMGSNLKSANFDNSTRDHLLKAFSRLKQKVIWKWEDENQSSKPDNVKIMKWCPQNDIMAHPNLKLFISHGGLLSTTESVYHAVPIVGIPIFADQKMNVATITRKGYGLAIPYDQLTEERLVATVQEVLTNPKYRNAIQLASQILREQPIRPLDSAVFWVEHVLKHRGATHFRSAALDLDWYQIYSVDIFCIILLITFSIFLTFFYITNLAIKYWLYYKAYLIVTKKKQ